MKQWHVKVLVVFASITVGFLLAEVGLALLGIEYPIFYDYDPHFGHDLRPGIQGYYLKEGGGYVTINSDGLRDIEHAIKKPLNTIRVAVLGDSYTEAMQVNREEAFWAVMEQELQDCKNLQGKNIEVINFGVSGFGTTQEILMLRQKVWKYSPDIVILAFFSGNDVTDNSFSLKKEPFDPYHIIENGKLILTDQAPQEIWEQKVVKEYLSRRFRLWLGQFRVVQVLHRSMEVIREWWSNREVIASPNVPGKLSEPGLKNGTYRVPTDGVWQEAWKVTEGVLVQMRDEIVQKGARFFVIVLTDGVQVHPNVSLRNELARSLGVKDLLYPDRRLEKFCQSHAIPVLLLAPYFQDYASQHQVFLHGFGDSLGKGHWNQNGHRLAGETIAQWLCPRLN